MEINWRRSYDCDSMNVRMIKRVGIFGVRVIEKIEQGIYVFGNHCIGK